MPEIIVIAHNIRSTHNVGSIFRTCEGFGVKQLILSGYTPVPFVNKPDPVAGRLPHEAEKTTRQIHKTALGAETMVPFMHYKTLDLACPELAGYLIVALEQHPRSIPINSFTPPQRLALLLGEEVNGIPPEYLTKCHTILEIPMNGKKESFNVSVAAGIALYALTMR
ncbi:MAG: TrmH family RNA methyltransferase [Candidatus Saccharimonas sp.]